MIRARVIVALMILSVAGLATSGEGGADLKGILTQKLPDDMVWSIELDGKGAFTVKRGKEIAVQGSYKVNKDEITITDEKGPLASSGDAKSGTYRWKLEKSKMTLTVVKDAAVGRSKALTSGPWEFEKK